MGKTSDNTEAVIVKGKTNVLAFHVNLGTATFDEDVTIGGALTMTGSSISIPDNQAASVAIGSTGRTDLLTLKTSTNNEAVIVKGTTSALAFHVNLGTATFDEDVTIGGVATFNGNTTLGNAASDSVLFSGITKLTAIAKTGTSVTIAPGSEGGSYYTLGAEGSSIALTLAITSAVDGQLVYVYNGDNAATTNVVIPAESVAMFIYQGGWRRVEDKQISSRRRLLSEEIDNSEKAPTQAAKTEQQNAGFAEVLARLE